MSSQNEQLAVAAPPKPASDFGGWLDDRFRGAKSIRNLMNKVFPDHWSFFLGEIALYSFVVLLLTGTFLTLFFQPSMSDVIYHGSYTRLDGVRMSQAYASTLNISFDVRGGLLMRQIHHWAADLFMAAIFAHMLRIFFTGAYRKPRDVNWLIGVTMLILGMLEGLFGYSLPDDLLSGTGLRILEGVLLSIPIVGTYLTFFLFGGQFPGTDIIPRLYIIHVLLIPALLLGLVSAHLFIMFHQKHTQYPGKTRTDKNVIGQPFYPYFIIKTSAFFFFVFGVLALLATVAQVNPIWLYGPYNPVSISAGSQPDFYMGFMEGTLRVFPSWTWDLAGHTVAWDVVIPALVPLGVLLTGAALWPWIERWATGDNLEHHLLDRPRNAPTRTAIGVSATVFYMIMLLEGANDLIADHLDIPLYTVTWIARFAVFIGPAVAYWLTKRICLGLQRKDRDLLHHGVETGIIRQLPSGEFIEVTRPVSDERRAVLLSKKEPVALPAAGVPDENGIPAPGASSLGGRVRLAANRVYSEGIPMTTNGHGNGHGGNGHGSNGHSGNGHGNGHVGGADHAAVGTTSSSPAIEDSGEPAAGDQGPVSGGDADS